MFFLAPRLDGGRVQQLAWLRDVEGVAASARRRSGHGWQLDRPATSRRGLLLPRMNRTTSVARPLRRRAGTRRRASLRPALERSQRTGDLADRREAQCAHDVEQQVVCQIAHFGAMHAAAARRGEAASEALYGRSQFTPFEHATVAHCYGP
jgi:hypothetical protein